MLNLFQIEVFISDKFLDPFPNALTLVSQTVKTDININARTAETALKIIFAHRESLNERTIGGLIRGVSPAK